MSTENFFFPYSKRKIAKYLVCNFVRWELWYLYYAFFTNSINVQPQSVPSYWHCILAFSTFSEISVCFIQYASTQLWGMLITGKVLQTLAVISSNIFNEVLSLKVGTSATSESTFGRSVVLTKSSWRWNERTNDVIRNFDHVRSFYFSLLKTLREANLYFFQLVGFDLVGLYRFGISECRTHDDTSDYYYVS